MKVGVLARAEDRGLGNLTREFVANMNPERVLVVRPQAADTARLRDRTAEWYGESATRCVWEPARGLDEYACKRWLDGLDVVYSAETFYDWRFCEWARDLGVRTVCHMMPEYFRADHFLDVDVWWTPTRWRLSHLPRSVRVVPVPIPTGRFPEPSPVWQIGQPLRWLHPAGAHAKKDRNGTIQFLRALQYLAGDHAVTVRSQGPLPMYPHLPDNVRLTLVEQDHADYWDAFTDIDVTVIPRKYGGLCMPALEAMGAGTGLAMTNVTPQSNEWPIIPIDCATSTVVGGVLRVYEQELPLAVAQPEHVAAMMDGCAADPERVLANRVAVRTFRELNSWVSLRPEIESALVQACD